MIKTRSEQFKNLLEILIIALLVIIAFFWTTKSYAFTIAKQNVDNTFDFNHQISQTLGNNLSGSFTDFTTEFQTQAQGTMSLQLYQATGSATSSFSAIASNLLWEGRKTVSTTTRQFFTMTVASDTYFQTSTPNLTFNPNLYYWFILDFNPPGTDDFSLFGSSQENYSNGYCFFYGTQQNCSNEKDIYFTINGSFASTTTNLIYPTDGMNTRDFTYWKVQANGTFSQIGIRYKLASSTTYQFVNLISPQSTINNQILSILKDVSLTPTNSASSSFRTWNAQLYYIDSNNNEIDQTPITFNVGNYYADNTSTIANSVGIAPNLTDYNGSSTSIEGCQVDTFFSIPYIRNLGQCLINVAALGGNYLFTPPANFTQYLTDSANNFKNIFPFSIAFPLASSTQNSINAGYGAEKTFVLPLLISSTSVTLFDSSTVNTVMGPSNKTTYFSVAGSIMYAITGYKIIMAIF